MWYDALIYLLCHLMSLKRKIIILTNSDNNVEYIERLDSNNSNNNNNNESILIAEAIIQEKELKTIVNENKDQESTKK